MFSSVKLIVSFTMNEIHYSIFIVDQFVALNRKAIEIPKVLTFNLCQFLIYFFSENTKVKVISKYNALNFCYLASIQLSAFQHSNTHC